MQERPFLCGIRKGSKPILRKRTFTNKTEDIAEDIIRTIELKMLLTSRLKGRFLMILGKDPEFDI